MWIVGISFSCDVMEITLLMFLQGCVRDEWNLSSSTESLLTSVVFAGIFLFLSRKNVSVIQGMCVLCGTDLDLVCVCCTCTAKCSAVE